jgi:ABC-type lipopolysaccharide export system ATPase subunit
MEPRNLYKGENASQLGCTVLPTDHNVNSRSLVILRMYCIAEALIIVGGFEKC